MLEQVYGPSKSSDSRPATPVEDISIGDFIITLVRVDGKSKSHPPRLILSPVSGILSFNVKKGKDNFL